MEIIDKILDASEDAFNRYGIKSVSMDNVAAMLGVSKKTLYLHVSSKEELVKKVLERKLKAVSECVCKPSVKTNALEEVMMSVTNLILEMRRSNPALLFDLKKYYPSIYKIYLEFRGNMIMENFSMNLRKGIEEGLYRKELNVNIISHLYFTMIEAISDPDFAEDHEMSFEEKYKEVIFYHLHGICSEKGQLMIQKLKQEITKVK